MLAESEAFPSALPARREVAHAAWVTIQIGCDNSCAFCIVPSVRGKEISRPFGELVAEVERLAADGVVEITLLGQNVNSYGRDLTTRRRTEPADPLDRLQAGRAVGRRRPSSAPAAVRRPARQRWPRSRASAGSATPAPTPRTSAPRPSRPWPTNPAVCPHLHLPLQSGSDRILAAMHRGYTAERYLDRLAEARRAIADLAVTTDLIVGFPGETDDDFDRTLEVVAAAEYDSAYTFIYSPRPGTEAAERVDEFVAHEVIAERFERLRVVVERSAPGQARGPRRPGRGDPRRGSQPQGPDGAQRPHRAEQARAPGRSRPDHPSRDVRRGSHHQRRTPLPARRAGRGHGPAPPPHPHPGGGGLSGQGTARRDWLLAHGGPVGDGAPPGESLAGSTAVELAATGFDVLELLELLGSGLAALHAVDPSDCPFDTGNGRPARAGHRPPWPTEQPIRLASIGAYSRSTPADLLRIVTESRPSDPVVARGHPRRRPGSDVVRVDAGRIVGWDAVDRCGRGDAYRDLATMATSLVDVVGPEALGPFLDAYGIDRPDVLRLDWHVMIDQILR